jgi:hypothetical protein
MKVILGALTWWVSEFVKLFSRRGIADLAVTADFELNLQKVTSSEEQRAGIRRMAVLAAQMGVGADEFAEALTVWARGGHYISDMNVETQNGELWYPRNDDQVKTLTVSLVDVRAADDLVVGYDFDRDGWVIARGDEPKKEVAFVSAWASDGMNRDV